MSTAIEKLVSIASPPLGPEKPESEALAGVASPMREQLLALLRRRNGFYAFESALHVLPAGRVASLQNVNEWNQSDLWRNDYGDSVEGLLFFAEDIFGAQFATSATGVVRFDPETGRITPMANDIESWAARLLADYAVETGYPLAHDWQRRHGRLPAGQRLIPKEFFVLGGAFAVENLYALDAVEGMRLRAELARQIKDLPDGARVQIKIVDE
jgi:hypothetical protein